jgi:Domain of unknown function (DUF5076)
MHKNELRIPPQAENDPDAFEMLRAWAAGGQQHVSIMGPHYRDAAVWGVFVADLVRHLARSHHLNFGDDLTSTARTIRTAFEAEMNSVTDWGEGNVVHKP